MAPVRVVFTKSRTMGRWKSSWEMSPVHLLSTEYTQAPWISSVATSSRIWMVLSSRSTTDWMMTPVELMRSTLVRCASAQAPRNRMVEPWRWSIQTCCRAG